MVRKVLGTTQTVSSLLNKVNAARRSAGLRPLCLNAKLMAAAQAHANDQAAKRRMSHTGSDGSQVWNRVQRRGYKWTFIAENVAYGYPNVDAVFKGWMNSPGHRANILSRKAQHMGAGFNSRGNYWAQVFGASSSSGCSS
ncbi:SCP-like extracellular [Chlorella sorokiniana]|uniref:SCP-like extracellular n=1 Tax=Chlorella sorokiniana TaxID=3076 RepID=A0A2P6TWA4_CHLSO|nr:SCP-like extracellular [Chlorella sorokiniana]|eukprot:PRW58345.1 SCP-like extracellular [Chlorella sorokiniana]